MKTNILNACTGRSTNKTKLMEYIHTKNAINDWIYTIVMLWWMLSRKWLIGTICCSELDHFAHQCGLWTVCGFVNRVKWDIEMERKRMVICNAKLKTRNCRQVNCSTLHLSLYRSFSPLAQHHCTLIPNNNICVRMVNLRSNLQIYDDIYTHTSIKVFVVL